jgi:hypothetical protein
MFKMIGAALLLILILSIHAQGKVQGDPIVIGTQPQIENPEFKDPTSLKEAKEQIAKLKETIATNHIIWTIHCKASEERLLKHFSSQNLNHSAAPKKSVPGSNRPVTGTPDPNYHGDSETPKPTQATQSSSTGH